tara:strand:+ start:3321 stop:3557 length:237 start_codon:yes stop_codon:yes gene_type:complete
MHINHLQQNFSKFRYIDKELYKEQTTLKFYKQSNPNYVSQTLVPNMYGQEYDEIEVDTIKNIMLENNHNRIDLLKLDI